MSNYCNKCGKEINNTSGTCTCDYYKDIYSLQGWICPKCESIYSPFVSECEKCNKVNITFIPNTRTGDIIND